MIKIKLLSVLFIALFISSCEKKEGENKMISLEKVNGYVQKGPYLNGTSITISELTSDLIPTGKNFYSQILDNKGTFEVKNVELTSQYVELKADGFYFNEVNNANSSAQLTLYALSDLEAKSTLNVNVLSNLEKGRIEYLISNGVDFISAKKQAQAEILAIFEILDLDIPDSEYLDISNDGEGNSVLLAISVILQGQLTVANLSELLANINTDIREDGKLDSELLGTILINNALLINPALIRSNLEDRYAILGTNASIPNFERYISNFIENTSFVSTNSIEYPEVGEFGENILYGTKSDFISGNYSISAILHESTKVKVDLDGWGWFLNFNPYDVTNNGWDIVDQEAGVFVSNQSGQVDLFISLIGEPADTNNYTGPNTLELKVYENDALEPTWTKSITIN